MKEATIQPRMLRAVDAARYLAISTQFLRTLVRRGEIPAVCGTGLRTAWLFDIRDLDQWIERTKTTIPEQRRRKTRRVAEAA